ncbi:MAG: glycosyltransferase family 39 protein [Chthoniobacteraceae bacterium]
MPFRHLLWLVLAATVFHCLGNWALPLIDRDEPRFAEASREMLQRGDPIVPYFNGRVRFDKPPLIYWLQCGAYRLLGDNEFAARLPSALCAALTAVALAVWGARFFDATTGWRAALIFSTCVQTIVHARAAVADMVMVLFVTLAAWAAWEWRRVAATNTNPRREWLAAVGFALALGFGFLAKGPIAWLPLGMVWWSGLPPAAARGRHAFQWAAVVILSLGAVALWGIPALIKTGGEFARIGLGKHVVARSIAPMEGHGGGDLWSYLGMLPMYLVTVWISFFPWSIWLPSTARYAFARGAERRSDERYLLAGVILCFGIFTLVRTKLPHYTLPAFPFLALLVAAWWRESAQPVEAFRRVLVRTGLVALLVFLVAIPIGARQFPAEALFRQAAPLLRRDMVLATVDYDEPSLVWNFRRSCDGFQTKVKDSQLVDWLAQPGGRVAIMSEKTAAHLAADFDPQWPLFRADGWHPVKGRRVRLALIVKP